MITFVLKCVMFFFRTILQYSNSIFIVKYTTKASSIVDLFNVTSFPALLEPPYQKGEYVSISSVFFSRPSIHSFMI